MDNNIYNEIIMEHGLNSPYKKELDSPTCSALGHNPNCGDEIRINVVIEGGVIKDMSFTGSGCAISQGSTSLMIQTLIGQDVDKAKSVITSFLNLIKREKISDAERVSLGDAIALENVSNMPSRVKCAVLSWHTLEDLLEKLN